MCSKIHNGTYLGKGKPSEEPEATETNNERETDVESIDRKKERGRIGMCDNLRFASQRSGLADIEVLLIFELKETMSRLAPISLFYI